jgi:hypothetical protein
MLKRQEIALRTAQRERDKVEREVLGEHKRQVEASGQDLDKEREEQERGTR